MDIFAKLVNDELIIYSKSNRFEKKIYKKIKKDVDAAKSFIKTLDEPVYMEVPRAEIVLPTQDPNSAYVSNNIFDKRAKSNYAIFNIGQLLKDSMQVNDGYIRVDNAQLALTGTAGGTFTLFNFALGESIDSLSLGTGKHLTNLLSKFYIEEQDTANYKVSLNEDGSITITLKKDFNIDNVLKFTVQHEDVIDINKGAYAIIDYKSTNDISIVRGDYGKDETRFSYTYLNSNKEAEGSSDYINVLAMIKKYQTANYIESDNPEIVYILFDSYTVDKLMFEYPKLIAQFNRGEIRMKHSVDGTEYTFYNTYSDREKINELLSNSDTLPVYILVLKSMYEVEGLHYFESKDQPEGIWILLTPDMVDNYWGYTVNSEAFYTFDEIVASKRIFIKSECQRHIEEGIEIDLGLTDPDTGEPLGACRYILTQLNQQDMRDLADIIAAGAPAVTWRDASRVSHMVYTAEQFLMLYKAATEYIFRCRFRSDGLEELLALYTEDELDKIKALNWDTELPEAINTKINALLATMGIN